MPGFGPMQGRLVGPRHTTSKPEDLPATMQPHDIRVHRRAVSYTGGLLQAELQSTAQSHACTRLAEVYALSLRHGPTDCVPWGEYVGRVCMYRYG